MLLAKKTSKESRLRETYAIRVFRLDRKRPLLLIRSGGLAAFATPNPPVSPARNSGFFGIQVALASSQAQPKRKQIAIEHRLDGTLPLRDTSSKERVLRSEGRNHGRSTTRTKTPGRNGAPRRIRSPDHNLNPRLLRYTLYGNTRGTKDSALPPVR